MALFGFRHRYEMIMSIYCTTLCVSAVFAVARCPCRSVTLVDCIYTAEDIVKLLSLAHY